MAEEAYSRRRRIRSIVMIVIHVALLLSLYLAATQLTSGLFFASSLPFDEELPFLNNTLIAVHQAIELRHTASSQEEEHHLPGHTDMMKVDEHGQPLPKIAYVTFSHLNTTDRWLTSILPATEYIVPGDDVYYVVLASNWTTKYHELMTNDDSFRNYSHRIQPLFVECPIEGKSGESSCCKQEKGLLQFYDRFFKNKTSQQPNYDWVLFQDDDNFVRSRELQIYVQPISWVNESLIMATGTPPGRFLGQFGFLGRRSPYLCRRRDIDFQYPWGQPVVYNRHAFEDVSHAFRLGGLLAQCREYDVAHDVGNALLHWMFMFPALWFRLPDGIINGAYRDDKLGMHRVGRDGRFSSMKAIYEEFELPENKFLFGKNLSSLSAMKWSNATGFRTTSTFAKYGPPTTWKTEWHTMPVTDCI